MTYKAFYNNKHIGFAATTLKLAQECVSIAIRHNLSKCPIVSFNNESNLWEVAF